MLNNYKNINSGIRSLSEPELQVVAGGCFSVACPHAMLGSGVTGMGGLGDMGTSFSGSDENCPTATNSKTIKSGESKGSSSDASLGVPKLGVGISADNEVGKTSGTETTVTVSGKDCNYDGIVDGYEGVFKI